MRPDRPAYRVGETMTLTILASQPRGTVYIDIVREGQTVSTRSVEVANGRAEVAVDLTPDLVGTLELHAYKILGSGDIVRDTRLVVVDDAEGLQVSLQPVCSPERAAGDVACVYHPGDKMGLDIQVSDVQGRSAHSALGLAIVDESVYALAEQDPGFERLYFLLEQELMEPKYDIHGFSLPELIIEKPSGEEALIQAYQGAAFASLADATPQQGLFGLHANSHEETIERLYSRQYDYYSRLGNLLSVSNSLVALTITGLGVQVLQRRKKLEKSLGLGCAAWIIIIIVGFFIGISTSGDFLLFLGFCLAAAALAGMIGLLIEAIRQKGRLLGWILGLSLFYALTIFLFNYVADQSYLSGGALVATFSTLALVILILTALIIGIGFKALSGNGTNAGLTSILLLAIFLARCGQAMPQMAIETQIVTEKIFAEREKDTTAPKAGEPPRLRQYFPETLLWLPEALTDENGFLHLDILAADSITTWRMTALASTQDGRLGSASGGLRVFQDFFIDLDLPLALTVGDEVSIPVGVFNYLPQEQTVRLELQPQEWFELLDQPVKEVRIAANDIDVAYFRVRATQFGRQPFQVTAWGSQMSDAILKEVQVYPNGQQVSFSRSDFLKPGSAETPGGAIETILIPSVAITGTQTLLVKIYPGIFSQVVEGLESMLRMPYGCFEQTSSTTYPNVLVLAYLKATEQISPEVQFKAEEYINTGYQRLVSFEVGNSGGFSLFGNPPADRMLTAFGLLEFSDMSRVHDVDPAILQRAAEWLFTNQLEDGSWENDRGLYHEEAWQSLQNDRLPVTAYIVWSLVEAGFGEDARTQKGLAYLRERQAEAEVPYVTALLANALVAADLQEKELSSATQQVLDRLAEQAIREKENAYWASGINTYMGGSGLPGDIETTSLAALAFIRAGTHTELANAALAYLVQNKDSFGTWFSTHATVMALKALIESVRGGSQAAQAEVTVLLNGSQVGDVQVNADNFDVVQLISLADFDLGSENTLEIRMQGSGGLMYQVTGSYYLPWEQIATQPELVGGEELVEINVDYDRTELMVEERAQVNVKVALNQPGTATSMLVDLGLPPGFSVQTEDLDALVAQSSDQPEDSAMPKIERYELAGRQIIFYVSDLSFANPLEFSFGLKSRYPLRAQTPASNAYDYYNPQVSGLVAPEILVVNP